jgi:hypothetical protein
VPYSPKTARLIAGAAVLVALAAIAVLLIPPYAANWRLQSYLNDFADDAPASHKSPDAVRSEVLNAAATLGLPVHSEDVNVTATESGVKIDVLYIVHVDLAGYTIDLHFRPQAGG